MLSNKTIDQLWRIVAAGGGLDFDASRFTTDQLWRLAAASQGSGAKITFRGIGNRTADELWRLAAAGRGNVIIADYGFTLIFVLARVPDAFMNTEDPQFLSDMLWSLVIVALIAPEVILTTLTLLKIRGAKARHAIAAAPLVSG